MREKNTVQAWNYGRPLQQCWLLRQVNERHDYWYRRPADTDTDTGEYQSLDWCEYPVSKSVTGTINVSDDDTVVPVT